MRRLTNVHQDLWINHGKYDCQWRPIYTAEADARPLLGIWFFDRTCPSRNVLLVCHSILKREFMLGSSYRGNDVSHSLGKFVDDVA